PGAVLYNSGTMSWTAGNVVGQYGTALTNSGLFLVQTDGILVNNSGGSPNPTFVNLGTFRKNTTTGITTLSGANSAWIYNNSGVMDIQTGTFSAQQLLLLNNGGTISGAGSLSVDG